MEQDVPEINLKEELPNQLRKDSLLPSGSKFSTIKIFMKFFNLRNTTELTFKKTVYDSGDMVSIIMVQKHIKKWVRSIRDKMKLK